MNMNPAESIMFTIAQYGDGAVSLNGTTISMTL